MGVSDKKMAVPSYEELLTQWKIDSASVEQTFSDYRVMEFASKLDRWEMLAKSLKIPNSEIESIGDKGTAELQRIKLLECWKHRCGSKATYKAMIEALLQINRTDLAETIIDMIMRSSSANDNMAANESIARQPNSCRTSTMAQEEQMKLALTELEKEFFDLVVYAEVTLTNNQVHLDTITRRFRMLPLSVKRQYQTDDNYSMTRRRILNSSTIKELFDNLTELKHWNYMTPETLAHILQDINIDDIHHKIEEYTSKLAIFKANTKLRDLIGISFPVPDYCIELTMITEGWEDKTISDVEKSAMNILRRATYGDHNIQIGWKAINPGSIVLVFILMKSTTPEIHFSEKLCEICQEGGVTNVCVDGHIFYGHDCSEIQVSSAFQTWKFKNKINLTAYICACALYTSYSASSLVPNTPPSSSRGDWGLGTRLHNDRLAPDPAFSPAYFA